MSVGLGLRRYAGSGTKGYAPAYLVQPCIEYCSAVFILVAGASVSDPKIRSHALKLTLNIGARTKVSLHEQPVGFQPRHDKV